MHPENSSREKTNLGVLNKKRLSFDLINISINFKIDIILTCTIIIHGCLLSGLLSIRDAHAWIPYHQSTLRMSCE